jgi:WD40 repeat protein
VLITRIGDGLAFVSGADTGGRLRVWDLTTSTRVTKPLGSHRGPLTAVAETEHDGHPLAVTARRDGTLRVWDIIAASPWQPWSASPAPAGSRCDLKAYANSTAIQGSTSGGRPACAGLAPSRLLGLNSQALETPAYHADPVHVGTQSDPICALQLVIAGKPPPVQIGGDARLATYPWRTRWVTPS